VSEYCRYHDVFTLLSLQLFRRDVRVRSDSDTSRPIIGWTSTVLDHLSKTIKAQRIPVVGKGREGIDNVVSFDALLSNLHTFLGWQFFRSIHLFVYCSSKITNPVEKEVTSQSVLKHAVEAVVISSSSTNPGTVLLGATVLAVSLPLVDV